MGGMRGVKLVAALLLSAAALLLSGCASYTEGTEPSSNRERGPDTAVVVCGRDGTRVLTPRVEARPDGVHYVIDNRYGTRAGYSVQNTEGSGTGGDAPEGKSEHVDDIPPGKVRIGCEGRPVDGMKTDYGTFQVSAGASGYRSVEPECGAGMVVYTEGGFLAADAKIEGVDVDPVELTRRKFSDNIREGDVVEAAGYPGRRGQRTVRVVRDGRVVAAVEHGRAEGGWVQGGGYTACDGF